MKKLLILLCVLFIACSQALGQVRDNGSFKVVLKGTVTGRDSKELYVIKSRNPDRNIYGRFVIPIVDGKFEYTLEGDNVEKYELMFLDEYRKGAWRPVPFFPDADVVEFTLHDMDNADKNTVLGSRLNRAMNDYNAEKKRIFGERGHALYAELDPMHDNGTYHSPEAQPLYDQLAELEKERRELTPEAQEVMDRVKAHAQEVRQWQYEYMAGNPDLHSYSLLIDDLFTSKSSSMKMDIPLAEKAFAALSVSNPGHPYNVRAGDELNALKNLVPGGRFIDFMAPDLDGAMHTLSEEIAGKVVVIDLWASWCRPCRINSMNIMPLYEKYKDKGFTVVGIAREYGNTDDLVKAIARDGYPWLNLFDLDDSRGIWSKYAASNGAGRVVLVDENGTVVLGDAKAKDIAEYLASRFD